jgi:hypothetical protein
MEINCLGRNSVHFLLHVLMDIILYIYYYILETFWQSVTYNQHNFSSLCSTLDIQLLQSFFSLIIQNVKDTECVCDYSDLCHNRKNQALNRLKTAVLDLSFK